MNETGKTRENKPRNVIPMYKFLLRITQDSPAWVDPNRFYSVETAIMYAVRNYPKKSFVIEDHEGRHHFTGEHSSTEVH